MPYKFGKAILFSLLVWIVGFAWGSIIFMTPLNDLPPIPYVSSSPAISFPLLVIMPLASYLLAKPYLKDAQDKRQEGLRFGVTIILVNFILDLLIIVALFAGGAVYFASLTVWLGYAAVGAASSFAGRAQARQPAEGAKS
ncbi:MAG: hypothetical protein ACE5GO_09690 [Anaerolineales bacterium]